MNAADVIPDFVAAMEAAGVVPMEPISQRLGSGKLIRFRSEGDRPSRRNGWAVLHLDGRPAGAFGSYRLGVSGKWKSGTAEHLSSSDYQARRKAWADAQLQREADQLAAWEHTAAQAERRWSLGGSPDLEHAYLAKKGMSGEGLRQSCDMLLVPMVDISGRLWNIQRISQDGTKLFLKNGRTSGLMWICGEPNAVMCLGEGVATMSAVRRATGHAVVASFSEKNLGEVANLVHAKWPDIDKIVCADDDAHLIDNPRIRRNLGADAALAAALAIGGRLAMPLREDCQ